MYLSTLSKYLWDKVRLGRNFHYINAYNKDEGSLFQIVTKDV